MKKTLLLILSIIALLIPFSANADAPGGPVHIDLGIGWSSVLNSYSSSYYSGTESQGPHFNLGVKFRVAEPLMLGVDASVAIQPWNYGKEYSYGYSDGGLDYSYDLSVDNRLFVSGDLTLSYYPVRIFYLMVGAGVTGMNSSYKAGYGNNGAYSDSVTDLDGMEIGWNAMVAGGFEMPLAPFFRMGLQLRYMGGYITSGEELFDFSMFSINLTMSFL